MGKHQPGYAAKGSGSNKPLIELLYLDVDLLNSLESQRKGGVTDRLSRTQETTEDTSNSDTKNKGVSAEILGVSLTTPSRITSDESTESERKALTAEITPHDSAVVAFIEEVHADGDSPETVAPRKESALIRLSGDLQFIDVDAFRELMHQVIAMRAVDWADHIISQQEATIWGNPNLEGMKQLEYHEVQLDMMPDRQFIILTLPGNKQTYLLPIQKEFLRNPLPYINARFPSGSMGRWKVLGLMHGEGAALNGTGIVKAITDVNRAKSSFYEAIGIPSKTIVPIAIYQTIELL